MSLVGYHECAYEKNFSSLTEAELSRLKLKHILFLEIAIVTKLSWHYLQPDKAELKC